MYQLEQEIASLGQGNPDLSTYYTNMKTLLEQLNGTKSVHVCDQIRQSLYAFFLCYRKRVFIQKECIYLSPGKVRLASPLSKKEEEDWLTVNSMIVSWIYNTIDPSIRSTIADREIAKELWDSLKKRFSVTNGVRVQQLTKELVGCTQGTMSVELYCAKLQKLWEDLAQIESKSGCTCAHRAETERVND